jgi:hypothetical protein
MAESSLAARPVRWRDAYSLNSTARIRDLWSRPEQVVFSRFYVSVLVCSILVLVYLAVSPSRANDMVDGPYAGSTNPLWTRIQFLRRGWELTFQGHLNVRSSDEVTIALSDHHTVPRPDLQGHWRRRPRPAAPLCGRASQFAGRQSLVYQSECQEFPGQAGRCEYPPRGQPTYTYSPNQDHATAGFVRAADRG